MTFQGLRNRWYCFLVNHIYAGTRYFERKRSLLQKMGHQIGACVVIDVEQDTVVGGVPVKVIRKLSHD